MSLACGGATDLEVAEDVAAEKAKRTPRTARDLALAAVLAPAVWFVTSAAIHVALLLGSIWFGGSGGYGENGRVGAGGMTVDISIAGPVRQATPAPVAHAQPPSPPPAPERAPEPRRERSALRVRASSVEVDEQQQEEPQAEPEPEHEPGHETATANAAPEASGSGASVTSGGRAPGPDVRSLILGSAGHMPGSVEAQRALLPDAVTCADPVAGVWRAHKYNPVYDDWALFTLRIKRGPNDTLTGTIFTRLWRGGPSESSPPICVVGHTHDYAVTMTARGRAQGRRILEFGANSYRVVRAYCPTPFFEYNPDHFSGTVDPLSQEFQSVNNDGGRDVNSPYVFRRVACLD